MRWERTEGTGKKDCAVGAISIATGKGYGEIAEMVKRYAKNEKIGKCKRGRSSVTRGVYNYTIKKIMGELGWVWTPTMMIGTGCKVHLASGELPWGRLVVSVSKHLTCVINGVIHDSYDCSRGGTRCVYGFWKASK